MQYRAAIFDLDGTLANTLEDLTAGVNAALQTEGFAPRTLADVRERIGDGIRNLINRSLPEGTPTEQADRVFAAFKAYYPYHLLERTVAYDGVVEALDALGKAGIPTAVVSNKFDAGTKAICRELFGNRITFALGERPDLPRKPDPAMLRYAAEQIGATAGEILYFGDSEPDVAVAKAAGVAFVGVTYGFRTLAQLQAAGAERWIDRPDQILSCFSE